MARLDVMPLPLQLAGHIHQAAEITGEHNIGAGGGDRFGLLFNDGVGEFRVFHAKRAAKAATDIGIGQFADGQAIDRLKQRPRLCFNAQFAQARAGIMIGDGAGECGGNGRNAQNVGQEADQFMGLCR